MRKNTDFLDNKGKKIFEGNIVRFKNANYRVSWCNGAFKLMSMKSMFEGAIDYWLHEIIGICRCGNKNKKIKELTLIK